MIAFPTRWTSKLFVPVLLSFAPSLVASQEPPPPGSMKASVNLIELPTIVRDQTGRPITNLKADDFRGYDQGTLQTISRFRFVTSARKSPGLPPNVESRPLLVTGESQAVR